MGQPLTPPRRPSVPLRPALAWLAALAGCGALATFVSDDRARTVDGKRYEYVRWSTPVLGWRVVDGHWVPDGEARWQLPTGEFAYGRFEVRDIAYNVAR